MGLNMPFKALLVVVRRELLAAHRTHLPVTFNVFFKFALIVVGREHQFTEGTLLVNIKAFKERRKWSIRYVLTVTAPVSGHKYSIELTAVPNSLSSKSSKFSEPLYASRVLVLWRACVFTKPPLNLVSQLDWQPQIYPDQTLCGMRFTVKCFFTFQLEWFCFFFLNSKNEYNS